MKTLPPSFAQTLRNWRIRHEFTQQQASDMLRVNLRTLQGWEGGRKACPTGDAIALLMRHIDRMLNAQKEEIEQ